MVHHASIHMHQRRQAREHHLTRSPTRTHLLQRKIKRLHRLFLSRNRSLCLPITCWVSKWGCISEEPSWILAEPAYNHQDFAICRCRRLGIRRFSIPQWWWIKQPHWSIQRSSLQGTINGVHCRVPRILSSWALPKTSWDQTSLVYNAQLGREIQQICWLISHRLWWILYWSSLRDCCKLQRLDSSWTKDGTHLGCIHLAFRESNHLRIRENPWRCS